MPLPTLLVVLVVVWLYQPTASGLAQGFPLEVRRTAELSTTLKDQDGLSIPDTIQLSLPLPRPEEVELYMPSMPRSDAQLELYRRLLEDHRENGLEAIRSAAENYRLDLENGKNPERPPLGDRITYRDGISYYRDWIDLYQEAMKRSYASPMSDYKRMKADLANPETINLWFVSNSARATQAEILTLAWTDGEVLLYGADESPTRLATRQAVLNLREELADGFAERGFGPLEDYVRSTAGETTSLEHSSLEWAVSTTWTTASALSDMDSLYVELTVESVPPGATFTLRSRDDQSETILTNNSRPVARGLYSYRIEMPGYHAIENANFDLVRLRGHVFCELRRDDEDPSSAPCHEE